MKVHRRAVRTHCHEFSLASLFYFWWHVSMWVKPGGKLELSFLKGTCLFRHYLNMYVITYKDIFCIATWPWPLTALSNSISEKNLYQGSFSKSTSSGLTSWALRHGNKKKRKKTKRRQFRQTSTDCTHPGNETIITVDWARNICGCSN